MDFNVTLVGIIILLFVFIPVFYMIFIASGGTKKAKKEIAQIFKSNNATADIIEVVGNTVIGFDKDSRKLIYAQKKNLKESFIIFDLEDFKSIHAKIRKGNDKSIFWVGLELTGKSENQEITFYNDDSDEDSTRDPQVCFQDSVRWEKLLQKHVGDK